VARATERRQATDSESEVVEPCGRMLVEEPACPSGARSSVAACVVLRDQRDELERLTERHLADLPSGRLSHEQVATLDRPVERRSWVSL
jgi:hypothetical protein